MQQERQVMGREVVAITEGELDFGPWEQIFYGNSMVAEGACSRQDHW